MAFKRTKIVATLGPASQSEEIIKELIESGLDVARLNFSHGTHDEHLKRIEVVRKISKQIGKPVAIMQDLQGPKMRLGTLTTESIIVKKGDVITLFFGTTQIDDRIPVQFNIFPYLTQNTLVLINDGVIKLKVESFTPTSCTCSVIAGGEIRSHKGVNVPGIHIENAELSEKDKSDLQFGIANNVDYIAISFVQTGSDIIAIKELLKKESYQPKVLSKIECRAAIHNLESIIRESDAVMVARGDLAIEVGQEEVPLIQRRIITLAKKYATPVIVATQMLESMIHSSEPTRAEVNDIATAVLDTVDAVMLSAESAHGDYPVEAVQMMDRIIKRVEQHQFEQRYSYIPQDLEKITDQTTAITSAAALLAHEMQASCMYVLTSSGLTAFKLAAHRPHQPIIAITNSELVQRQLSLIWGIKALLFASTSSNEDILRQAIVEGKKDNFLAAGNIVVMVSSNQPSVMGTTNMIKLETIR